MTTAILILGGLGFILGLGLVIASKILYVKEDERVSKVIALLPGYNCGACGFPGCGGFADGIIDGKVLKLKDCKPGKDENFDPILEYLASAEGDFTKLKK